jgi:hypothetical protein
MQTLIAWLIVVLVIAAAYPTATWLLRHSPFPADLPLRLAVTLGLGSGALTLLMFAWGLTGVPFNAWGITGLHALIMLPGGIAWSRQRMAHQPASTGDAIYRVPTDRRFNLLSSVFSPSLITHYSILLISLAILFNAAYWPFHRDDVLGIYGRYGALMADTRALVPFAGRDDAFYQAYPMHIPLAYSYVYLLSGWQNEYLAALLPALLSLGCLLAVYSLGKSLGDERDGLLAALLLGLTPAFARWASSGYVDLPMAFFYTLAALFAWRLWERNHAADALLLGGALGLAAWTKNAAFVGIGLVGLWLFYGLARRRITIRSALIAGLTCLVIAAPWYARNWFEARLIVPPTAWTEQAARTLNNALVFVAAPQNFALTGWLIMIGMGMAAVQIVRQRCVASLFLLLLTLPFFAVWWLLVSYDPRFLLLFLPLLCLVAAWGVGVLWSALPVNLRAPAGIAGTLITVLLALYIAWISVEFKGELLRNPLMSDAEKRAIVLNQQP